MEKVLLSGMRVMVNGDHIFNGLACIINGYDESGGELKYIVRSTENHHLENYRYPCALVPADMIERIK